MKSYRVTAILHFPDGINKGVVTVQASSDADARSVATKKLQDIWNKVGLQSVEIVAVR